MRLNELRDRPGAVRVRKRVGRGIGSGKGKTAGRGTKGQKSRSGVAIKGFEGGQMPLHRRLPKRGFTSLFGKDYNEVNLGRVQAAIEAGVLDATKPVTVDALAAAGVIRRVKDGVRLLGKGEIKGKVAFEVTGASTGAVKAVEAAGGSVAIVPLPRPAAKGDGRTESQGRPENAKVASKPAAPSPEPKRDQRAAPAGRKPAKPAAKAKAKPKAVKGKDSSDKD